MSPSPSGSMRSLPHRSTLTLLGALLLLGACDDAHLTEPRVHAHEADGRLWVAVAPPEAGAEGGVRGGHSVTSLVRRLEALERWRHHAAGSGVMEGLDPEFDRARLDVAAAAVAGGRALSAEAHDEAAAHLAAGMEAARAVAPRAVAARVIDRAEERLALLDAATDEADRALRLLRGARLALEERDDPRALRRALYALQLAEAALSDG
jgi:hypothetical protein